MHQPFQSPFENRLVNCQAEAIRQPASIDKAIISPIAMHIHVCNIHPPAHDNQSFILQTMRLGEGIGYWALE